MNQLFILFSLILMFPLGTSWGRSINPIMVSEPLKTSSSWDGSPLPAYPRGTPEITIARITIQPGAKLPLHQHPVINAGVLLSGELTVSTVEGKTIHLKAGDAIAELVKQWHFGKNNGQLPAEIVVFYAGSVGSPITIEK